MNRFEWLKTLPPKIRKRINVIEKSTGTVDNAADLFSKRRQAVLDRSQECLTRSGEATTSGRTDQVEMWLLRALALEVTEGYRDRIAFVYLLLAHNYANMGQPQRALRLLKQARRTFVMVPDTSLIAECDTRIALIENDAWPPT